MSTCPFCTAPIDAQPTAGLAVCAACANPYVVEAQGQSVKTAAPHGAQDLREIAKPGSIGGEILKALPAALEELPVLPEISQRVMTLLRDPDMSMSDLADLIRQDQVIAIRILQLANSAMYGGLQEIKDLNAACSRLGTRTIANAVQAVANGNLYITGNEAFRERMQQLWRHAVATAHCAYELAAVLAEPRADELFVAGLIHDIGRVVLLDIVANQYRGVLAEVRNEPELLEEVFSSYSPLVGLHVAIKWNLPPEFRMITYFLRNADAVPNESVRTLTHVVALAEAVAEVAGYGLGMPITSILGLPSARALGMTDMKLATVRADLDDKLAALLEISTGKAA
ncbi:MAG: HDOD domain-containing protein [Candidatus Hydrogenedentes bacterium]|nr:HDOD domain-containing protein [Candidatus Hydrogenedentota bacterium]